MSLCLSLAAACTMISTLKPRFAPPSGHTLVIAGQDLNAIADYQRLCTVRPAGYAVYTSLPKLEGLWKEADNGGGRQFASKVAEDNPNGVIQVGLYMVNQLQAILDGKLDREVDSLAKFIRQLDRPVFLRFGYEFDYPENRYDPDMYKKAYRYFVDRLREQKTTNVAYVWHSFAQPSPRAIEDWFPGDDYVDWCAVSYFDQGQAELEKMATFAKKHQRPLMIAESAPWRFKPSEAWETWFVPMFDYVRRHDVAAICYINCDWGAIPMFVKEKWGDSRLSSDPSLTRKWNEAVASPRFLNESPALFKILGG